MLYGYNSRGKIENSWKSIFSFFTCQSCQCQNSHRSYWGDGFMYGHHFLVLPIWNFSQRLLSNCRILKWNLRSEYHALYMKRIKSNNKYCNPKKWATRNIWACFATDCPILPIKIPGYTRFAANLYTVGKWDFPTCKKPSWRLKTCISGVSWVD